MLHLQDQKYCYFERTVTVAVEMSRPYLLNNTITIVDILDTETEQNIFAVQNMYSIVSCTQIYAASLLKYLKHSSLLFPVTNSLTQERKIAMTNSKIIAHKIKIDDILIYDKFRNTSDYSKYPHFT